MPWDFHPAPPSVRQARICYPPAHEQSKKGRAATAWPHGEANGARQGLGRGYGAVSHVEMLVDSGVQSLEEGMAQRSLPSQPTPATSTGTHLGSCRKSNFH